MYVQLAMSIEWGITGNLTGSKSKFEERGSKKLALASNLPFDVSIRTIFLYQNKPTLHS